MALSHWNVLALDQDGQALPGILHTAGGVAVEIYKNWIYIHDPHAWRSGIGFCECVVAQIDAGQLRYQDIRIEVVRGPQDGVFVIANQRRRLSYDRVEDRWLIGCGINAYAIMGASIVHRCAECDPVASRYGGNPIECPRNGRLQYLGVTDETIDFLRAFIRGPHSFTTPRDLLDHLANLPFARLRHLTQSDARFARLSEPVVPRQAYRYDGEVSLERERSERRG